MRVFLVSALVVAVTSLGILAGCNNSDVGSKCQATGGVDGGTNISSPAVECNSRLCYQQGGSGDQHEYCTARCDSDDDCKGALISQQSGSCPSSFVCAVATEVGTFACQQFCICSDDLRVGLNLDVDGKVMCPVSCQSQQKCPAK